MSFAACITVVLAIFVWSGAVIWSLWRAAWIRGALIGVASVTALLFSSRAVAGAQPVAYGITLGLSLFLGSAMVVMGIIAHTIRALARLESE